MSKLTADPVVQALNTAGHLVHKLEGIVHPDVLDDLLTVRRTLAEVIAYGYKGEDA